MANSLSLSALLITSNHITFTCFRTWLSALRLRHLSLLPSILSTKTFQSRKHLFLVQTECLWLPVGSTRIKVQQPDGSDWEGWSDRRKEGISSMVERKTVAYNDSKGSEMFYNRAFTAIKGLQKIYSDTSPALAQSVSAIKWWHTKHKDTGRSWIREQFILPSADV